MAKKRGAPKKNGAANTTRRERGFDDLVAGYAAPLQDVCRAVRGLVRATLPEATEGVYGGAKVGLALYAVAGGKTVICGIQPSGDDCLFYLHNLKPDDSPRLKLEGQGKHARHVKLRAVDGETRAELVALIRLALARSSAGRSAAPETS